MQLRRALVTVDPSSNEAIILVQQMIECGKNKIFTVCAFYFVIMLNCVYFIPLYCVSLVVQSVTNKSIFPTHVLNVSLIYRYHY